MKKKENDKFGYCSECGKKAIAVIESNKLDKEKVVCEKHFIEYYKEEDLEALIENQINCFNKISEPISIQKEIKKQKVSLYNKYKKYFKV